MIEVIYKEERQGKDESETTISVPRNIRQIGNVHGNYRIYMEDYVYSFLGKTAEEEQVKGEEKSCLAVLMGETQWKDGITYVFIRGALIVDDIDVSPEHINFRKEIWMKIQEEEEAFFPGQEIVGWFFARQSLPLVVTETFQRAHLKYFGGGEKVLMLMEPTEREDVFFRYENGQLIKVEGYYIFYEKNPRMQVYIMQRKQETPSETETEVPDEAVKRFRRIIQGKELKKQEEQETRLSVFSYAATACLAIAVLAVGINFYQNYQKMRSLQEETQEVSVVVKDEIPEETKGISKEQEHNDKTVTVSAKKPNPTVFPTEIPAVSPTEMPASAEITQTPRITQTPVYSEESDMRKVKRKEAEAASAEIYDSYVIRPGDTLYHISMMKYGSMDAISEICRLNNLSQEEIIYPGQIIVLP